MSSILYIFFSKHYHSQSGGPSVGAIVGIIIAVVIVVGLAAFCCKKRKHAGQIIRKFSKRGTVLLSMLSLSQKKNNKYPFKNVLIFFMLQFCFKFCVMSKLFILSKFVFNNIKNSYKIIMLFFSIIFK